MNIDGARSWGVLDDGVQIWLIDWGMNVGSAGSWSVREPLKKITLRPV